MLSRDNYLKNSEGTTVADCCYSIRPSDVSDANAALIVRAVNNYQPMIDAAREVLANWESGDLAGAVNSLRLATEEAEGNI